MSRTVEQYHRDLIRGVERGAGAMVLRGILGAAEPVYSAATLLRNAMFARGIFSPHRAGLPVVSVGNITTGGTGKTPVVLWLAQAMRRAGRLPAVLMRGYKSAPGQAADEQRLLAQSAADLVVQANPDRVRGAREARAAHPEIDLFLLDDGFQHRRLQRDFDLVLIDASNPFGFGHVLPRGLLREPLSGLARADAFLITHTEIGEDPATESVLRRYCPLVPIYRCQHVQTGLRDQAGVTVSLTELRGRNILAFCGIGNPQAFFRQLGSYTARHVTSHCFGDHHHYTRSDLARLGELARQSSADVLVTTEKDWVKLEPFAPALIDLPPIWRVQLSIQFAGDDESRLLEQITRKLESSPAAAAPGAAAGA